MFPGRPVQSLGLFLSARSFAPWEPWTVLDSLYSSSTAAVAQVLSFLGGLSLWLPEEETKHQRCAGLGEASELLSLHELPDAPPLAELTAL